MGRFMVICFSKLINCSFLPLEHSYEKLWDGIGKFMWKFSPVSCTLHIFMLLYAIIIDEVRRTIITISSCYCLSLCPFNYLLYASQLGFYYLLWFLVKGCWGSFVLLIGKIKSQISKFKAKGQTWLLLFYQTIFLN